jgi:hypothetical protein
METYTLSLALEDFIPVILSSIGLYLISRMVAHVDRGIGRMAFIGWLLITLGGFCKATWKLNMALSDGQSNLVWLDKGLFLWLAAGFTLMTFAVWFAARMMGGGARPSRIWFGPLLVFGLCLFAILSTGFPDPQINTWRFILLGVATIANVMLVILLIRQAWRLGLRVAAVMFALNIILVFTLNGMARMPDQTIPLQWLEQMTNTIAQAAFLLAAWQVNQAVVTADATGDLAAVGSGGS